MSALRILATLLYTGLFLDAAAIPFSPPSTRTLIHRREMIDGVIPTIRNHTKRIPDHGIPNVPPPPGVLFIGAPVGKENDLRLIAEATSQLAPADLVEQIADSETFQHRFVKRMTGCQYEFHFLSSGNWKMANIHTAVQ